MFKQENQIWLYLIGIIILFGILIAVTTNVLVPVFINPGSIDVVGNSFDTAPEFKINTDLDYQATITTNMGSFTIDLFEDNAPNNVNNFVYLAENNYYLETKFHRLVPNFLFHGGDRNTLNDNLSDDGFGRPGYTIIDESNWDSLNLSSDRRTVLTELGYSSNDKVVTHDFQEYYVGMANGGPNTNGSQFFVLINSQNDPRVRELDGMFTPIGKIIEGYDTINTISQIPVDNPELQSPRPTQDIIIENIVIITK